MALIPQEKIDQAKNSDLLAYLIDKGYKLIADTRSQNGKSYRLEEHDSLVISNNKWFWFSQNYGGNTLDFLMKYEGKAFRQAVEELTNERFIAHSGERLAGKKKEEIEHDENDKDNEVILPEKAENFRRVFAYLTSTRGIDKDTISELMHKKLIYESKDGHNCVFVGYDKGGKPRYANLRGTLTEKSFKKECLGSNKKFSFSIQGKNNCLRVFESAIDAISDITIAKFYYPEVDPYNDHRLSLGGVETIALDQYLSDHPNIKDIVLRLDNDSVGRSAAERIQVELVEKGYSVYIRHPKEKDVNADLLFLSSKQQKDKHSVYHKIDQVRSLIQTSQEIRGNIKSYEERQGTQNVKCDR